MAEQGEKTEAPTERRLNEAARKGEVAVAAEVRHATMLAAAAAIAAGGGVSMVAGLLAIARACWGQADEIARGGVGHAASAAIAETGAALSIPLGLLAMGALAGGALQGKVVLSSKRITPQFKRVSPISGWSRLFGKGAILNYAKTLIKLLLVGSSVIMFGLPSDLSALALIGLDVGTTASLGASLITRMLIATAFAAALLGVVDLLWSKISFIRRMRMSREDVRDEMKTTEGDPHVRSRQRGIRLQRGRRRMIAEVSKAAVVVMNPTHFAVALAYEHGVSSAPRVVARGLDALALAIRAAAERAGVPVVVNPPLARALYATAKLDQPIPMEHYRAVAEVITYVLRMSRRA